MKGDKLHINILILLVLVVGIIAAVIGLLSWSQGADTEFEPLLYCILFAIGYAFTHAYGIHPEKERYITKGFNIRLKHAHITTAYAFAFVGIFSIWSYDTLHLISTGFAIGAGYFALMTYPETRKGKTWAWIGFIFGIGGFFLGFVLHFWSVAWGEVLAAFPLAIQMFVTLNYK